MSRSHHLVPLVALLACTACGSKVPTATSSATATPPADAAPASHDADCQKLITSLDALENKELTVDDQGPPDVALRAGMQIAEQGSTELGALSLSDAVASGLASDYTTHVRAKLALMKELLPPLERFSTAAGAAKKAQAASEAELEPCKAQKKLSKACEAKVAAATEEALQRGMAVAAAQTEMRKLLESPVMKERDAALTARDQELAQQLHERCNGPKPAPAK